MGSHAEGGDSGHEERVAIWGSARNHTSTEQSAGTCFVVNDHRLLPGVLHLLCNGATKHIHQGAWDEGHHEPDGFVGIGIDGSIATQGAVGFVLGVNAADCAP